MLQMCLTFKFLRNCHLRPETTKYNIGQHWGATLVQGWVPALIHNVAWTLSQHQSPVLGWHCHNVHTMLPEHCLNVGHQRWGAMLPQCSHDVAWTLSQCESPTVGIDIAATFTQCCLNIVSMLITTVGDDIATTFIQSCQNIVSTSLTNVGEWHCHEIHTTLPGHCLNVIIHMGEPPSGKSRHSGGQGGHLITPSSASSVGLWWTLWGLV